MTRSARVLLAAMPLVALAVGTSAWAVELSPSIDIAYSYGQTHTGEDVLATVSYNQRYGLKYVSALSAEFDLAGSVRLELADTWALREADTNRLSSSLEVAVKGALASFTMSYEGVASTSGAFQESGKTKTYSTAFSLEGLVTPDLWPETRLKLQNRHDFQPRSSETSVDSFELQMLEDFSNLRLEFNLKKDVSRELLPEATKEEATTWSGKATYRTLLWGETSWEFSYDVKEDLTDSFTGDVLSSTSKGYSHRIVSRMGKSVRLTPLASLALAWQYQIDQDLLAVAYDTKLTNKYRAELRYDFLPWMKLGGGFERATSHTMGIEENSDAASLADTLKVSADLDPLAWLRFDAKAEFKHEEDVADSRGGSGQRNDQEKYEATLKNKLGQLWDLSLSVSSQSKHEEGWLTGREAKFKAALASKLGDLAVKPSYETSRKTRWGLFFSDLESQVRVEDWRISFEWRYQYQDLIQAVFSHAYGLKSEDELDAVRSLEHTLELNEDTRIGLSLSNLIRDLQIEGEITRAGTDALDDSDPMLVNVSYGLGFAYQIAPVSLGATLKYNSKGSDFDDMTVNTRVSWKDGGLTLSGEYQFEKVFGDETDENRRLNLRLGYQF